MKIHRISIRNFKSFEAKTFDLNPRFTIFIGENATGKTTVLDALAVALGGFLVGLEGRGRGIGEHEIRIITTDGQPRPQLPVIIEAEGQVDRISVCWKREILNKKITSKDLKELRKITDKKLNESRKPEEIRDNAKITFPVIALYSTGRLWAEHEKIDFQAQEEGIKMAYTNCLSAKSSPKETLAWFKTQEDQISKFGKKQDIAHLNAYKAAILALIPDNRWQDMVFDTKAKYGGLVGIYTDAQGVKHKLDYNQLSDGYRNLIGIAADIAYRCIQLNPHLGERAVIDTPGVVLIDELDLHLHPNWQKRVVHDLMAVFPNIQFVATTHSPFIVQSLTATEKVVNLDNLTSDYAPNDLPINKVATEIMGVKGIRSDDFEERTARARQKLAEIEQEKGELTLDDYQQISQTLGQMLVEETNDPEYKAYLQATQTDNDL